MFCRSRMTNPTTTPAPSHGSQPDRSRAATSAHRSRQTEGDGQALLQQLDVVEHERQVERVQECRDQPDRLAAQQPAGAVERVPASYRSQDLQQVNGDEPSTQAVHQGQQVGVEGRLEEGLRPPPVAGRDRQRPAVVLLAVHGQLGHERGVVNGSQVEQPQHRAEAQDRQEQTPTTARGR